jgi:hypothetical protein
VATTDPATLPKLTTWYLLTNLHRPASRRAQQAQLAEIVGTSGLRNWVEQGYKQVKDELGWGTSRSAVTGRSAGTGRWCAARSAAAGTPATLRRCKPVHHRCLRPPRRRPTRPPRGGPSNVSIQTATTAPAAGIGVSWPQALRRVRARLAPWVWRQRCWRGWSTSPPPPPLQQALDWVRAGQPIYLYLPP